MTTASEGQDGPAPQHHDGLDLTPRRADELSPPKPKRSRAINWAIGLGVVCLIGFMLFRALTDARVYFLNADEAVEQRDELEDQSFRMQGVVVSELEESNTGSLSFDVAYNDVAVQVRHVGAEPTDLFDLGMPVVVEGHWDGDVFISDQILVKHSEEYIADNGDRPGVGQQ